MTTAIIQHLRDLAAHANDDRRAVRLTYPRVTLICLVSPINGEEWFLIFREPLYPGSLTSVTDSLGTGDTEMEAWRIARERLAR